MRPNVGFTIGGHANNHQPRFLDDHLYLMCLRFYDYDLRSERLKGRATLRKDIYDKNEGSARDFCTKSIKACEKLALQEPRETTIEFPEFRRKTCTTAK